MAQKFYAELDAVPADEEVVGPAVHHLSPTPVEPAERALNHKGFCRIGNAGLIGHEAIVLQRREPA